MDMRPGPEFPAAAGGRIGNRMKAAAGCDVLPSENSAWLSTISAIQGLSCSPEAGTGVYRQGNSSS